MVNCHACGRTIYDPDGVYYLDCAPSDRSPREWKKATLCQRCIDRIDPDIWINRQIWESIRPDTPFESLPSL